MRDATKAITFRAAGPDDEDFLLRVYSSSREYEMSMVPWDDRQKEAFLKMQLTAQQEHYQKFYPNAQHQIIVSNGEPVGRVYVERNDKAIRILDITILPQFRNSGIGTPIIEGLIDEARRAGKSVRIYVESYNPSARLFERLGFSRKEEDGINILFEYRSGAGLIDHAPLHTFQNRIPDTQQFRFRAGEQLQLLFYRRLNIAS